MSHNILHVELNKSSSDVAAEGAILNEMLDIVAKRAALRPFNTTPSPQQPQQPPPKLQLKQHLRSSIDGIESDVSQVRLKKLLDSMNGKSAAVAISSYFDCLSLFLLFVILYACILYVW